MTNDNFGEVTTFYSYKGGTGRSMALANVACILAKSQKRRVLMIDWDLEAPGLHRFFRRRIIDGSNPMDSHTLEDKPGLIELFIDLKNLLDKSKSGTREDVIDTLNKFNFDRYILETDIPKLYLIKSGRFDSEYSTKVNSFRWEEFYCQFPDIFKNLASYLSKTYMHILIDSRTGVTDISGITTMLMPNRLIAVFTPNRQSLTGVLNLITEALDYRKQSNDLRPLIVFPLPSRIEASEPDLRKKWRYGDPDQDILGYQVEFEKLFKEEYDLADCGLEEYFNEVQIQHVPRYSYGEEIAVLVEASQDRLSLSQSYENFAKKIVELRVPWIVPFKIPLQIPPPPRDFKGREEEITDILSNFRKGATITGLRGMGGVGKTALALVLAEKLKSQFPDGQIFVDMRGTSNNPEFPPLTPEDAMAQIIRAYNPADRLPENSNELRGLYLSILAGKRALLLLDNAASGEQVEPLLPPAGCAVLITSRIKFALSGLTEKDLDILPSDNARELLLGIAPRVGDHAEELARLCGYLPIALRNAASSLAEKRDLSVPEYERLLKDKVELLKLVKGSFSLSYDLLTPGRKKQWRSLSVFPEDFDRNAATAVLKMAPGPSAEALSDLVRCSLVDFTTVQDSEDGRYKLHDLARLFAESCLEGDELADAQQKHANHYSKVLSQAEKFYEMGGTNLLAGLKLFDREWANIKIGQAWVKNKITVSSKLNKSDLRLVLQMASSYAKDGIYVLDLRLYPRDKIDWLETGLKAAKMMKDRSAEGAHLGNLGLAYADLGETREAIGYLERALKIARKIGDQRDEEAWLGNLGLAYAGLGDTRKAIEYHEQALAIAREIGNKRSEGRHLGSLGLAYFALGEMRKALEYHEQALAIAREIGDKMGEGVELGYLGQAYAELGETLRAIEYYEHALAIAREIRNRWSEGANLSNLGNAHADLGETRKAIEYYDHALAISQEIGYKMGEGIDLGNLGQAYADLGETRKAIEHYDHALTIAREIGDRKGEGVNLGNLGLAYVVLGETRKALEYHENALAIAREIKHKRGEEVSLGSLGLAYAARGETRKALEYYEEARAISREIGDRANEGVWLDCLGLAYATLGVTQKAIKYHAQSLAIACEIGDKMNEGDILCNFGKAYLDLNETEKAIGCCMQSLDIVRKIEYQRIEGEALCTLGKAYSDLGQIDKAIDHCDQALKIFQKMEYRRGEGDALFNKSLALHKLSQQKVAADLANEALQIFQQIESPLQAEKVRQKLAEWGCSPERN